TIPGRPDFALTNLWVTDAAPASNAGSADAAKRPVVLEPPRNGTIFRVVEFPPDRAPGGFDRAAAFAAMGADHAMDPDASRHPRHRDMCEADRVGYGVVVTGEIGAVGGGREVLRGAGDTLVQRGTNHAWSNRSDPPCLVAFTLVSAGPAEGKASAKPARRGAV